MSRSINQLNIIFDSLKSQLYNNRLVLFKNIDETNSYIKNVSLLQKKLNQQLISNEISNKNIKNFLQERVKPIVKILKEIDPESIINNSHDYKYILNLLFEDTDQIEKDINIIDL